MLLSSYGLTATKDPEFPPQFCEEALRLFQFTVILSDEQLCHSIVFGPGLQGESHHSLALKSAAVDHQLTSDEAMHHILEPV